MLEGAAGHRLDEGWARELGDGPGADGPRVPQHGDAVGDIEDLIEEMRDQDDAEARRTPGACAKSWIRL